MKNSKKITLGLLMLALVSFLQLGYLLHGHLMEMANDPCLRMRIINFTKSDTTEIIPFMIHLIK